jgi:hypothetical protein
MPSCLTYHAPGAGSKLCLCTKPPGMSVGFIRGTLPIAHMELLFTIDKPALCILHLRSILRVESLTVLHLVQMASLVCFKSMLAA